MNNFTLALLLIALCLPLALWAQPIKLELRLAEVAQPERLFQQQNYYWISEKYDGIRAYWDGQQLWTRQGHKIHAPSWFIKDFPTQALDGELWLARGEFERASAIARTRRPKDADWQQLKFMAFDLPDSKLPFEARQHELKQSVRLVGAAWLRYVEQTAIGSPAELEAAFQAIIENGGEGLMLNTPGALYQAGETGI